MIEQYNEIINVELNTENDLYPLYEILNDIIIITSFNKVLWNSTSGWDGKSLVLNNGATAFIPLNVFDNFSSSGLTIELDFETVNVQDEDAVIFSFEDANNPSAIKVTACGASALAKEVWSGVGAQAGRNRNTSCGRTACSHGGAGACHRERVSRCAQPYPYRR